MQAPPRLTSTSAIEQQAFFPVIDTQSQTLPSLSHVHEHCGIVSSTYPTLQQNADCLQLNIDKSFRSSRERIVDVVEHQRPWKRSVYSQGPDKGSVALPSMWLLGSCCMSLVRSSNRADSLFSDKVAGHGDGELTVDDVRVFGLDLCRAVF